MLARADGGAVLHLRHGNIESYSQAAGKKVSLSLQRNGNEFWGFLDASELGIYGLVSGTKTGPGRLEGSTSAGTNNLKFSLSPGFLGFGKVLSLKPQDKAEILIQLKSRRTAFRLKLEIFQNPGSRAADSRRRIEIGQIGSRRIEHAARLDLRLRRGEKPADHAFSLLKDFDRAADLLPSHTGPDTLMLKPYVLSSTDRYLSLAQETYLFQGGAHGISVMVFDTIDMGSGKIMEASDFFKGDWQSALPSLLSKEVARQLSGTEIPGKKADAASLTGYGLFEDLLPLPSGIFPCPGGFGFHYNRYEIAPGAMGDFLFILPFGELEGVLREEWKP